VTMISLISESLDTEVSDAAAALPDVPDPAPSAAMSAAAGPAAQAAPASSMAAVSARTRARSRLIDFNSSMVTTPSSLNFVIKVSAAIVAGNYTQYTE
jgi:hypothetical protein